MMQLNFFKNITSKIGLHPGFLDISESKKTVPASYRLISYNKEGFTDKAFLSPETCCKEVNPSRVNWVIVRKYSAEDLVLAGQFFSIDSLLLEDMMNPLHRPKTEFQKDQIFITLRALKLKENNELIKHQVNIIVRENIVLMFTNMDDDFFEPILKRISGNKGKIRLHGTDYLMNAIIDLVVDHYLAVNDSINQYMEELEEQLLESTGKDVIDNIQIMRKRIVLVTRSVVPLRDIYSRFVTSGNNLIKEEVLKYFFDVNDHLVQLVENLEHMKENSEHFFELYNSNLSRKTNQVVQVLTIISTIFIPLTFIAGVYGMNFHYMPELEWRYGYFIILSIMFVMGIVMFIIFKRKKWF